MTCWSGTPDALERLQAENDRLNHECEETMREIAILREENDRMREALELIAEGSTDKLKALQAKAALNNIGADIKS